VAYHFVLLCAMGGSGDKSPASHPRRMRDLFWTKWHRDHFCLNSSLVGASHSLTNGPVSGPQTNTQQVCWTALASAAHHRSVRPITGQLTPANHRPVYLDQSQTIQRSNRPYKKRPHWPVELLRFQDVLNFVFSTTWTVYHQVTETKTILVGVR